MNFTDLPLQQSILDNISALGYTQPTPIQEKAIPVVLSGKNLLATAQTGTGKTAAFTLPIIEILSRKKAEGKNKKIRCLILTPTRELAIQIEENCSDYGKNTGIRTLVVFGGVKQGSQENQLRKGTDILVATPGRLLDFTSQGIINLKDVEIFVLDEADRMLDMGFVHDVKKVIKMLPPQRQNLLFSATMPSEIVTLSKELMNEAIRVEVAPVSSTADTIQQKVFMVDKDNKVPLLLHLLENQLDTEVLVFARTKHGADKIVKRLVQSGVPAEAIHGNKSQNARQNALANFKSGKTKVLVATDIAARGIDISELKWVVNFELSDVAETYVHRIGRTGRAGADGASISFVDGLDLVNLKNTEKLIGKKIPLEKNHPFHTDNLIVEKRESTNKPFRTEQRPSSSGSRSATPKKTFSRPNAPSRTSGSGPKKRWD